VSSVAARQVLRLRARDFECGVELARVERVLHLPSLRQVPGGANYLAGLMIHRGRSVAVVDLALWLGLERSEPYALDTPVVLCGDGARQTGLLVDEVAGVQSVAEEDVQMRASFGGDTPFAATLNAGSGMALLLDIERILAIDFAAAARA